jgi:hypothetical protein
MIYWILSDIAGKNGRRHDGDWEPLSKRGPASDEVERFHRYRDAVAKAKKLRAKDCHTKPLKQEGIVFFWHLPAAAGESDLAEVIECLGTARPAKRKARKK